MTILSLGKLAGLRLRGKLLIAFLIAAVLPFVLLGITSTVLSNRALKKKTTNTMVSGLRTAKASLESYMNNLAGGVTLQGGTNVATRDSITNLISFSDDPENLNYRIYSKRYSQHFKSFLDNFSDVKNVFLIGTAKLKGQAIGKIAYVTSSEKEIKKEDDVKEVHAIEKIVNILGDIYIRDDDQNPVARAYILALDKLETIVLDFEVLKAGEDPYIWIAAPVMAEEDTVYNLPVEGEDTGEDIISETVGVLLVQVSTGSINRILPNTENEKSFLAGPGKNSEMVIRSQDSELTTGDKLPDYLNRSLNQNGVASYGDSKGNRYPVPHLQVPGHFYLPDVHFRQPPR
ncbi:hypothetical protein ACFLZT_07605 [Thermodesulfobacteriota bacterium]